MTQDEIIEMAKEAGFVEYELDDGTINAFDKRYEAFAKLVAAKERERCAFLCDELWRKGGWDQNAGYAAIKIRELK
jgi:hypothetical protein